MFRRVWSCVNKTQLYRILIWPTSVCHILSASFIPQNLADSLIVSRPRFLRELKSTGSSHNAHWTFCDEGRSRKPGLIPVIYVHNSTYANKASVSHKMQKFPTNLSSRRRKRTVHRPVLVGKVKINTQEFKDTLSLFSIDGTK
jgi:hypothetical protein